MIGGTLKKESLSIKEILEHTSQGYDVFMLYLGKVDRSMKCPWRRENNPSFGVFFHDGCWYFKDFTTEEGGDAILFVRTLFNLSVKEAKDKICWDFALGSREVKSSVITWPPPSEDEKEDYCQISFSSKPFTEKHHAFWNRIGINETHCNRYECWAVKDAAINRRRVAIMPDEMIFAYYEPTTDSCKLYFPEREGHQKFRTSTPYHTLWNTHNLEGKKWDHLLVNKSNKDMIVAALFTPAVTATTSEAVKIFSEEVDCQLRSYSDRIVLAYGSDQDGMDKAGKIIELWSYETGVHPPLELLPEVNDLYSLAAQQGIGAVEQLFKQHYLL